MPWPAPAAEPASQAPPHETEVNARGLTIEAVAPRLTAPGETGTGPASEIEAWSLTYDRDPGLTDSTDTLRRARLRAATGFLAIILAALVVWRSLSGGGVLLAFQAAVAGILALAYALVAGQIPLSHQRLRRIEFAIFALTSAFLATRQYQDMHRWMSSTALSRDVEGALVVAAVKTTLIGTMMLTFAYCMLIPNTWRSAAVVVAAMIAVPVATEVLLYATHPHGFGRALRYAAPERVSEDVALMLIAAGLSVYGTHVINSLRVQAFEARQLNQYRLVRRLGVGGMGEVYLAEHRLLKRPCAVKIIQPLHAGEPIELARFEREVRATARLSHPNTVEIFDYGRTEDGTFFYVMEYLPGLSLDDLVKRHGPMPAGRVVHLLRQVCGALAEAHAVGLVHRDVKPGNIFASFRGGRYDVAKLLDFGLVKGPTGSSSSEPSDLNRAGMIRGTPLYMAPEQITGDRELDHRCDLYALGSVAYRLLTGQPPFVRETRQEVMSAHAYEAPLPPRRRNPDVPADLEDVVLRCLAKSPADRYPDADALEAALASCASASGWDAKAAARWWAEFEPDELGALPHPPRPTA